MAVTKLTGTVSTGTDNVIVTVPSDTTFTARSRYDVSLSAPVAVAAYNLPVVIEIDGDTTTTYPVTRLGFGNVVFGQTIRKDGKLVLYYTDNSTFTDLRHKDYPGRG